MKIIMERCARLILEWKKFTGILCAVFMVTSCNSQATVVGIDKPNIVYIMADDLGIGDIGVYGQEIIATPHIDRLAAEGMIFYDFYAGSTVCAPSRATLLTGQHTGTTKIRGNGARKGMA